MRQDEECWLSVIVTAYNVEPWISRCIESLLQYILPGVEIVVVDDGSTDRTFSSIRQFKYAAIRSYSLPQNIGVSAARNFGIKQARGKYLSFVDGDDFIGSNYYEVLRKELYGSDADLYSFDALNVFLGSKVSTQVVGIAKRFQGDGVALLDMMRCNHINSFQCWRFVVNRAFLLESQCFFPEEVRLFEDVLWLFNIALKAFHVSHVPVPVYNYCQRSDSAINKDTECDRVVKVSEIAKCIKRFDSMVLDARDNRSRAIIGYYGCHFCFSAFHQLRKIRSAEMRRLAYCALLNAGATGFLVHNAKYLKSRESIRAFKRAIQLIVFSVINFRFLKEA